LTQRRQTIILNTFTVYFLGAVLLSLIVQQSSSQLASLRDKEEAESRDRLNFFDLDLLKVTFITENAHPDNWLTARQVMQIS
jgi:hypothetical protein